MSDAAENIILIRIMAQALGLLDGAEVVSTGTQWAKQIANIRQQAESLLREMAPYA
jgi:hypothetical protein